MQKREPRMRINLKNRFTAIRARVIGRKDKTVGYSKIGNGKDEDMAYVRHKKMLTGERQQIMIELANKGINVERIIGRAGKAVITEHLADRLYNQIPNMARKQKLVALKSAAEQLSRINMLGYEHGHPHLNNTTWDGCRAGIIDFTLSRAMEARTAASLEDVHRFMAATVGAERAYRKQIRLDERLRQSDFETILRAYCRQFPKTDGERIYASVLKYLEGILARARLFS